MIRNNLTYEDLEDLLAEKVLCIKRVIEAEKAIRYGWTYDEDPKGGRGQMRKEAADRLRAAIGTDYER